MSSGSRILLTLALLLNIFLEWTATWNTSVVTMDSGSMLSSSPLFFRDWVNNYSLFTREYTAFHRWGPCRP